MRPLHCILLAAAAATPGACGVAPDRARPDAAASSEPDSAGRVTLLRGPDAHNGVRFVERIDSDVALYFRAQLIPPQTQHVVMTGIAPGADQSCVLVFDESGELLMRHRASGDAPIGRGHHLVQPNASHVRPFDYAGRRWLIIMTSGLWDPYSVEVLEITSPHDLVPRYRFWNPGVFSTPVAGDGLVAFRCLNNDFRAATSALEYPVAVGVLSMDYVISESDKHSCGVGVAPTRSGEGALRRNDPGYGYVRYFVLPEANHRHRLVPLRITIRGRRVLAATEAGVTYSLDPDGGNVLVTADDEYRAQFESRRRAGADSAPIDEHLKHLAQAVRSFVPEPR